MAFADPDCLEKSFDVCVIGAGPAGISCALSLSDSGHRVLLLEAGGLRPTPGHPEITAAEILTPHSHAPTNLTSAASLGGTGHWWGGRCVPLDPVDLGRWPLCYSELASWTRKAAAFFGATPPTLAPPASPFSAMQRFHIRNVETWGAQLNMARRHEGRLRAASGPAVLLNAHVVGLNISGGKVASLSVRHNSTDWTVRAPHIVLACGGLGVMRLLLLAQCSHPSLFGGPDGPLGKGYMGHLTGSIALISPRQPGDVRLFHIHDLPGRVQSRRRIQPYSDTVSSHGLANIAFWLEGADGSDPAHRSAAISSRHVAARVVRRIRRLGGLSGRSTSSSGPLGPHIRNIIGAPMQAASGLGQAASLILWQRLTGRHPRSRPPMPVQPNAYRLDYHAEQRPSPDNRVSLSDQIDSAGLQKLRIRMEFQEEDIQSVVQMHEMLDEDLRRSEAGHLIWRTQDRAAAVRASALDGYHQLGGAAMSVDPSVGIVDPGCRTHDLRNLWIASSCVFPTGGQANPTLSIVALSLRIADRIASLGSGTRKTRLETSAPSKHSEIP